jgi:hypothetical protein
MRPFGPNGTAGQVSCNYSGGTANTLTINYVGSGSTNYSTQTATMLGFITTTGPSTTVVVNCVEVVSGALGIYMDTSAMSAILVGGVNWQ